MTDTHMFRILEEIKQERFNQDFKWGEQNYEPPIWIMILGEEFGEASKEACDAFLKIKQISTCDLPTSIKRGKELNEIHLKLRAELLQVAAVAVNFIESLDRNELKFIIGENDYE